MQTDTATTSTDLNLQSMLGDIKTENEVTAPTPLGKHDQMTTGIDQMVSSISGLESDHSDQAMMFAKQMETFGAEAQKNSGKRSQMLKQSIGKLNPTGSNDPNNVGNLLMNLNSQVSDLDPSGVSLDKPWWANLQTVLPFLKTPLQKYFLKYQSADSVMDNIRNGLLSGQAQLKNDSKIMTQDQRKMREAAAKLTDAIAAGTYMKDQLDYAIANEIQDEAVVIFVKDQILFPLIQRIIDLQQQLAVNQQGIMSSALIIRTNKDLIAGVDRALTVTMSAMEIAVALSLALANQRLVLSQLSVLNKTTGDMIHNVGKMLGENAKDVQEQAANANLDMDQLKDAMALTRQAIADVQTFRVDAVEHMSNDIAELGHVLEENDAVIKDMDKGEGYQDAFEALAASAS
jgi:uncharacterized protein YaaN involved in tellurite resistance